MPAGLSGSVSLTVTNVGRLLPDVAVAQDWSRSRKTSSRRGASTSVRRTVESGYSARSDSDYDDEYHNSSSEDGDSDGERQHNGYNKVLLSVTAFLDGFQRGDDRKSASGATVDATGPAVPDAIVDTVGTTPATFDGYPGKLPRESWL